MSTLSGIAAKGEKGKARYQLLDINNLFHANRGESSEPHQHKNISSRRHGMQSLGKVLTSARRRAPANLPSLKSEYSGNDPAISLVPSGGSGWGSKPGETGPPPSSTQVSTSNAQSVTTVTSAPSATVVAPTISPTPTPVSTPAQAPTTSSTSVTPATAPGGDKSWSSITSSGTESSPMFLGHQSIYFQQEFPSLSGDGSATSGSGPSKIDTTHLPGPSLRPQTEGSWMQGGSRPQGQIGAGHGPVSAQGHGTAPAQGPLPHAHLPQGLDVGGGRNNLGPSGAGVGPAGPMPPGGVAPHYRLMPQFMIKHNHPSGGFPHNLQHGSSRSRFPHPPDARFAQPTRGLSNAEQEEVTSRPIIKEEDLKVMDEIARDTGWAAHDEIDYNQTLAFSDEEGAQDDESKSKNYRQSMQITEKRDSDNKNFEKEKPLDYEDKANRSEGPGNQRSGWQQRPQDFRQSTPPVMMAFPTQPTRLQNHAVRQGEDDEVIQEKRRLKNKRDIAMATEKAKQRKEEEEKRYEESRQAAARKLEALEGKMKKRKSDKEENTGSITINVPHGANAILPDWEKEKSRSRTNSEDKEEKPSKEPGDNYRNVQVDTRSNFGRDRERDRDREARPERDGGGQPFSRQFQSNLPPRFKKQVADRPNPYYRQSSGGSPLPSGGQPGYDKWPIGQPPSNFGGSINNTKNHNNRSDNDVPDREREETKENTRDGMFENHDSRYNRPPSRDSRERSIENNWKSSSYLDEPSRNRNNSESELTQEFDNKQYEKREEAEEVKLEKEYRFYEESRDMINKSNDSLKSHSIQEDPFDERNFVPEPKSDDRRELSQKSEFRERPDRPQRPDSRDSRASRDSRNSKESIREENRLLEENFHDASWADSTFDMDRKDEKRRNDHREERDPRRDSHANQTYIQRHIPGPITKEKLEASELRCESARNINLVPLVRTEKKSEMKKTENQWETGGSSGDPWQRIPAPPSTASSESWADMTASTTSSVTQKTEQSSDDHGAPKELQQSKTDMEELNKNMSKTSIQDRDSNDSNNKSDMQRDKMGGNRGGNRGMRHDSRTQRQNWGSTGYYRGGVPPSWRGGDRGRMRSMGMNRRQPHGNRGGGGEFGHSESEASADEVSVSTESGKEDKRLDQERKYSPRSPKQGSRKVDKDDRRDNNRRIDMDKDGYPTGNENRRYDKRAMYDGNQVGIGPQPRGEPSRRGRGSAPFRSKGTSANTSRMITGYGLPTSKKPFTSDSSSNVNDGKKSDSLSQNQLMSKDEMSLDDKMKMNQPQFASGIIENTARPGSFKSQSSTFPPRLRRKSEGERRERKSRDTSRRAQRGSVKSGSGSGGEGGDWETTSETSEHEERDLECEGDRQNDSKKNYQGSNRSSHFQRHSQSNRNAGREKRSGGSYDREGGDQAQRSSGSQSMVNGNIRNNKPTGSNKEHQESRNIDQLGDKKQVRNDNKEKRNNLDRIDLCNTASVVVVDDQPEGTVEEDQTVFATDNNGFQEVRSKKNVKDTNRLKEELSKSSKDRVKANKPSSSQSPGPPISSSAPPNKSSHERQRPGKLPPRLAKQKEMNRMQKMGQQPYDVTELNKINQGMSMFPVKDLTSPAPPPPVNAWDKPITALRTSTPPAAPSSSGPVPDPCNVESNDHMHSATSSQRSSPSGDKSAAKLSEKAVLDGTSPPVQTIIFENTNYKSAPVDVAMKSKYTNQVNKNQKLDKGRERKLEEDNVSLGFKSPGPDMKLQETKTDPIQLPISFNKNEDNADMKLDFRFDSELSQLTEDKSNKSLTAIQMTRSIQQMSTQSSASAADLQFKLASVKKVWENTSVVLEHGGEEGTNPPTATSFTPSFGNTVEDTAAYGKPVPGVDPGVGDDGSSLPPEAVYSSGQQLQNNPNTYNGSTVQNMMKTDPSSNVCKVKPQPQAPMHHSHHAGPLSPPASAFNSSPAQPSQHISYQPAAPYGGISAIPSPPAVYQTQAAELYQTFQINSPQVLGSQGRSQFSQFAPYQLSQSLGQSTGFSQQSLYLHQTAPPPPPPSAAPPDIFQTQLNFRLQQPTFGNTQQLSNNPNTVLISSSTNSLMSATVKPSPQPIGAIGTKGASYQTTSQPPPSQLYIYSDPNQQLGQSQFLLNSTLVQRPANNIVPAMPPSSASYYSATTGGGATGFYQPGNSSMQAAAHQTTYNMQPFNTQSPAATPAGMGSFGSTFLSNGLQMAQQYRSSAPSYLKSAPDHQDALSVFSSPASQINSPKSRATGNGGGCGKQGGPGGPPQQQPSPTQGHHKFSPYQQNVSSTTQLMIQQQQQQQRGSMSVRGTARYPAPIQRPVTTFPRHLHRAPSRYKPPPTSVPAAAANATHYYVTHSNTTKLDNAELEAKSEVASSECESSKPSNTSKPSDVANEDSKSAND